MSQIMPAHNENVERFTPSWVGEGLNTMFDLDPAAPDGDYPMREWVRRNYSAQRGEDGLTAPWEGLVWMNPPWTRGAKTHWVKRLSEHGNGIALVRGGVDSAWLHDSKPDALFLIRGRVGYVRSDDEGERQRKGGATGGFEPSMLLAYGEDAVEVLRCCTLEGMFCEVKK